MSILLEVCTVCSLLVLCLASCVPLARSWDFLCGFVCFLLVLGPSFRLCVIKDQEIKQSFSGQFLLAQMQQRVRECALELDKT